jgi:hypothetical protein
MWLRSSKRDDDLIRRVIVATRACELAHRIESGAPFGVERERRRIYV